MPPTELPFGPEHQARLAAQELEAIAARPSVRHHIPSVGDGYSYRRRLTLGERLGVRFMRFALLVIAAIASQSLRMHKGAA